MRQTGVGEADKREFCYQHQLCRANWNVSMINQKCPRSNASVACKNLCAVFGKDIVNVRTCQRWFSKFRSQGLSLQERDRSGRPSKIDNDVLRSMLENNPHLTSREIAEEFGINHTTVGDHIKSLGNIISNSSKIKYPSTKNTALWWDRKGPVYYELLKQGKTINVDLYCNQLDKLNAAITEKRPALVPRKGIVFHHDNAQPHTAMVTQQKLNALGWEVLGHPQYSPDIAPSDYYLNSNSMSVASSEKRTEAEVIVVRLPRGPDGTNGFVQLR
ncbi:histone-lysine N-methyltransferase SETMAR [Trichonephila clavipes]|uniref:Histone-lysine N-methyltransferase SETMAR n=1 Tax=Trichonephila clavipes TaxID=2585209 RepID=A0A8X6R6J6_TRICX|nr:histone-lysine N-methyltransferase SETMAR [Trichonephila clavipes]